MRCPNLIDGHFPCDADQPWYPKLLDIRGLATKDPYYAGFGFEALEVFSDCPNVTSAMPELAVMFNETYDYRMVNAETLEQWQTMLQRTFDRHVRSLEYSLTVYRANARAMTDIFLAETETITGTRDIASTESATDSRTSSGTVDTEGTDTETRNLATATESTTEQSATGTSSETVGGTETRNLTNSQTSSVTDTPDTVASVVTGYASQVTRTNGSDGGTVGTERTTASETSSTGSTTVGTNGTDTGTVSHQRNEGATSSSTVSGTTSGTSSTTEGESRTRTRTVTDDPVARIEAAVKAWHDVKVDFIGRFENNFLNVFWY